MESDLRLVPCPLCDGYAVIVVGTEYDYWQGPSPLEEACPKCEGTGQILVEVEPITLEDLETVAP